MATSSPPGRAHPAPQARWQARATTPPATALHDRAVLLLLVLACWSSYGSPTIDAMRSGAQSLWTIDLLPGVNVIVVAVVVVLATWCLAKLSVPAPTSALDVYVALLLGGLSLLHVSALARGAPGLLFQLFDVRALLLFGAGYFATSRLGITQHSLKLLVLLVAGLLVAHAGWLTVRYGILGNTGFATSSGRIALLITEDSLLLAIPVTIAWGLMVDGLLRRWQAALVVAFVGAVGLIELLSLRRGALIFIGALIVLRSLRAPSIKLLAGAALALTVAAVALTVGPLARVGGDASYAARSALLLTNDDSSSQRRGELADFQTNIKGPGDVLLGHGMGAIWSAAGTAPTDEVSYGGQETALIRVGWHIYGLDWLYKFGLAGAILAFATLGAASIDVRQRSRAMVDRSMRSLTTSAALTVPVLLLFVFTNARVSLFAGLVLGLVSLLLDRAVPRRGSQRTTG